MTAELTTVVSTFNNQKTADQAVKALQKAGFRDRDIAILKGDSKKLVAQLADRGFDKEDAQAFADAAAQGNILVTVSVPEEEAAEKAANIMDRLQASQTEGQGSDKSRQTSGKNRDQVETVEIVEEELNLGKSKATNGGVRVTSSVSEEEVEEAVTLKDEHVGVKRKSADRELGADEAEAAFEEKTVELMGVEEQIEVSKEARVVGEVELTKETEEREETVRDTVRKTDAKVDRVKATSGKRS
jgi:uncharacterized protein (TIGR02271 family)